jgi:hypothetical protein
MSNNNILYDMRTYCNINKIPMCLTSSSTYRILNNTECKQLVVTNKYLKLR